MKTNRIVLFFFCLLLSIFNPQTRAAVITWTNTSGGAWTLPSNWSPNREPTNTDTALITQPGTYTVALDQTNTVLNLTVGATSGSGTQMLLVTDPLNVASNMVVQGGGFTEFTNSTRFESDGGVTVTSGGTLTVYAGFLNFFFETASLTVTNGGKVNAIGYPTSFDDVTGIYYQEPTIDGPVLVANGGTFNATGGTGSLFAVGPGGTLNAVSETFSAVGTNEGTINLTNADFAVSGYETQPSVPGLLNLPGGVINLTGTNYLNAGSYFTNQGRVVQYSGSSTIYGGTLAMSGGIVTNLEGSMVFQYIGASLTGNYYSAADASIVFDGADEQNTQSSNQMTLAPSLALRGPGQFQLLSGYLYLTSTVPTNLELSPDSIVMGPGFQGGTITNLTVSSATGSGTVLENPLPITGTLTVSNAASFGPVLVKKGAVFNLYQNSDPYADRFPLTVDAGGTANFYTGPEIGFGIIALDWTNYGTINLQDAPIQIFDGILNLPGGTLNIFGASSIMLATTNAFLTNLGAIVQNSPNVTNTFSYLLDPNTVGNFGFNTGVITNLAGGLLLESLPSYSLSGSFYAAAGAVIQFAGPTTTSLTLGTPLTLSGPGQYQVTSGNLYLAGTLPPNLSLTGGLLHLGPAFQGGTITNLSLDGITLTNSSAAPMLVTGLFGVTNVGLDEGNFTGAAVYGNFIVTNRGTIMASNSVFNGELSGTNGGTMDFSQTFTYSNVTAGAGCTINAAGWQDYGISRIGPGATLNLVNDFDAQYGFYLTGLILYTPLTNDGTINLTNSGIELYQGTSGNPGIVNLPSGTIHFWASTGISGQTGYLLNEGQIVSTSAGLSGFQIPSGTNSGTLESDAGSFLLGGNWTFTPSSILSVVLSGATDYGSFTLTTNEETPVADGRIALAGSFTAALGNGYAPASGTSFDVLSYGTETGKFAEVATSSDGEWSETYGATNFVLTVGGAAPAFSAAIHSGANIVIAGTGGTPGGTYELLTSTNLDLPLPKWTVLTTNTYSATGTFSQTNAISTQTEAHFYIFKSLP